MNKRVLWIVLLVVSVYVANVAYGSVPDCVCLASPIKTSFSSPVLLVQNADRYYLVEQRGKIYSYSLLWDKNDTFLDIQDKMAYVPNGPDERGLLSVAFHPQFSENKKFYTFSVRPYDSNEYIVISEFQEKHGRGDLEGEKILLAIQNPSPKRNGGSLFFGSDGYLYVGVGDGGIAGGTGNEQLAAQAQNGMSLLGKILRIDVNKPSFVCNMMKNYAIPADNPFPSNGTFLPEIYAYGCRNMFRCSVDIGSPTDIYCGDTGNHLQNEINIIRSGKNYGWNIKEGNVCVASTQECENIENEAKPIYVYNNTERQEAVIGGYVYRGSAFPSAWKGNYIFGDLIGGLMRLVRTGSTWEERPISICAASSCPCDARGEYGHYLHSLSQDLSGELYILTTTVTNGKQSATALKLVPPNSTPVTCDAGNNNSRSVMLIFLCLLGHLLNSSSLS